MQKQTLLWIGTGTVVVGIGTYIYIKSKKAATIAAGYQGSGSFGGATAGATDLNYLSLANDCFNAMSGWTTDSSVLTDTMGQLKSDADFDSLYKAYGTRTISSGLLDIFSSDFTGDLSQSIKHCLSSGDLGNLNTVLRANGITKTF